MRNRLAGAIAATAIAAAALVACSPPGEQDSDIKVTDQQEANKTFEKSSTASESAANGEAGETAQQTGM